VSCDTKWQTGALHPEYAGGAEEQEKRVEWFSQQIDYLIG